MEASRKKSKWFVDNSWWLLPPILVADILIAVIFIRSGSFTSDSIDPILVLVVIELSIIGVIRKESLQYLDLRSPVYRVQGKLIKEKHYRKRGVDYSVIVRQQKFSDKECPDLPSVFDKFETGDEVVVEYSPHTKHVWKMYKTQDI